MDKSQTGIAKINAIQAIAIALITAAASIITTLLSTGHFSNTPSPVKNQEMILKQEILSLKNEINALKKTAEITSVPYQKAQGYKDYSWSYFFIPINITDPVCLEKGKAALQNAGINNIEKHSQAIRGVVQNYTIVVGCYSLKDIAIVFVFGPEFSVTKEFREGVKSFFE